MSRIDLRVAITSALAALLVSGCHVGPKYQRPPAMAQAPPAAYKESPGAAQPGNGRTAGAAQGSATAANTAATGTAGAPAADTGGWKVAQPQDAMLKGKWWEIYGDTELNALEEKLTIDNQTIKQYFANFMEARTLVAEARSQLYPTLAQGRRIARSQASANVGECGHDRQTDRRPPDHAAGGAVVGTGPVGTGAQPDQGRAVQRAGERGGPGEREADRAGEPGGVLLRDSRAGRACRRCTPQTVADDQKALESDALAVRDGGRHGDFGGGGGEYTAERAVGADQPGRGTRAVRARDCGADRDATLRRSRFR